MIEVSICGISQWVALVILELVEVQIAPLSSRKVKATDMP